MCCYRSYFLLTSEGEPSPPTPTTSPPGSHSTPPTSEVRFTLDDHPQALFFAYGVAETATWFAENVGRLPLSPPTRRAVQH